MNTFNLLSDDAKLPALDRMSMVRNLLASHRKVSLNNVDPSQPSSSSNTDDFLLGSLKMAEQSYQRSVESNHDYTKSNNNSNNFALNSMQRNALEVCQDESCFHRPQVSGDQFCQSVSSSCYESSVCDTVISEINSNSSENRKGARSSEESMRAFALQRPIASIFKDYKCPASCKFGSGCLNREISLKAVNEELTSFWGDAAIATMERRRRIISKLLSAYHNSTDKYSFGFSIGTSFGQELRVCESAYLQIIGHNRTKLWNRTKKQVTTMMKSGKFDILTGTSGFIDEILNSIRQTKDPSEKKSRLQTESCIAFINLFGQLNGSKSPHEGEENLLVLPFEKLSQLYAEYCYQCVNEKVPSACRETFRSAYLQLKKEGLYKFNRGKGTFPTCDICNNANDLLASSESSKMLPQVRDLIVKLKVRYFYFYLCYHHINETLFFYFV